MDPLETGAYPPVFFLVCRVSDHLFMRPGRRVSWRFPRLVTAMDESGLIALQEKVAYLELASSELNDVVVRQQRQLDALERRCEQLLEQLQRVSAHLPEEGRADIEPPPHY